MDQNSARDFAIDLPQLDQQKVFEFNQWKQNRLAEIIRGVQPQDRGRYMVEYYQQMAQRQNNLYSMKEFSMKAAENCKVRSMFLPLEFDDRGFPKKWTQKEIAILKGNSKLKGYPADFDRLREGQVVELYLARQEKGGAAPKGKKLLDDDDAAMARPEVVMIVVVAEAPIPR